MPKLPGRVKFTWEQNWKSKGYILWHDKWPLRFGRYAGKQLLIADLYAGTVDARTRRIKRHLKSRAKT